jgi:ADP-heptose:LPS heptosyltransferase
VSRLKDLEYGLKHVASNALRRFAESPPRTLASPPRRILYVRYGGLGDMILSLPVFAATRAGHPDAELDVLCDRKNAAPLVGTGLADRIHYYEKSPARTAVLIPRLRRRRYDYVCNLLVYPSFTFGALCRWIGPAAVRAAGDQDRFSYFYNRTIELPPKSTQHMLDRMFMLAADLTGGDQASELRPPWIAYPEDVRDRGEQLFQSVAVRLDRDARDRPPRLAAVNMSAGLRRREWPLDKYAELLRVAIPRHCERLDGWAVFSDPADPARAEYLVAAVESDQLTVVPPQADFRAIMDFVGRCELVLTPDTSIAHAASAMGTPSLVMMIGENVTTWAPIGIAHRIAVSADPKCLEDLPVETVLAQLDDLLSSLP